MLSTRARRKCTFGGEASDRAEQTSSKVSNLRADESGSSVHVNALPSFRNDLSPKPTQPPIKIMSMRQEVQPEIACLD